MAEIKAVKSTLFPRKAGTNCPGGSESTSWFSEQPSCGTTGHGPDRADQKVPPAGHLCGRPDSWESLFLTWSFGLCCGTAPILHCPFPGFVRRLWWEVAEREWTTSLVPRDSQSKVVLPPSGKSDHGTCCPLGPTGSRSAGPSRPTIPGWGLTLPLPVARLCGAGSKQECLEGGKKAGGRKQPHSHPPNYWLGWQGRRQKADIVYLIKSKQQFAAASLPLAVCRALSFRSRA